MIRHLHAPALAFALAIFPTVSTAFLWPAVDTPPDAAPRPVASILTTDSIPNEHSIPGVIMARVKVMLAFQTIGRLSARHVDVGDVVKKDDLLAALDPEDLQDQVRAVLAATQAARVLLETATATAERTRALARRNVATTAQLEQAEQALVAAEATHQQARSELIRARDAESYAEMRAPFDGVISAVTTAPGAIVSAGDPIMQLSGQNDLEAVIDLRAAATVKLAIGDPFEVWSEHNPDQPHIARVSRIEPVADAATRTRRIRLVLDEDGGFRLGALVRARPCMKDSTGIMIPTAAIMARDQTAHVWVVRTENDQRSVTLRPIETAGPEINGSINVQSGLIAGDEVVVRGINSLTQGQIVGERIAP